MKVTSCFLSFLAFLSLSRALTPPSSGGFARMHNRVVSGRRSTIALNMAVDKSDPAVADELAKIEDMPIDVVRNELKDNGKRPRVTMSDAEVKLMLVEVRLEKNGKTPHFATTDDGFEPGKGPQEEVEEEEEEEATTAVSKFEQEMESNTVFAKFYNELKEFEEKESMQIVEDYVNDAESARSTYDEEHAELLDEIDAVLKIGDVEVDETAVEDDAEADEKIDDEEDDEEDEYEEEEIDDELDEIEEEEEEEEAPVVRKRARKPPARKRPVKTREAHIDCSNGVCELSILAACLDASTSSRSEASSLLSQIENRVKEELGDTSDKKSSTTIIEDDEGVRGLKISIVKNDAEYDNFSVAETVSLEELSFFCQRKSMFFEESTKMTCMDLFAELATVIEQIRGVEARAIQVSLDSVVQVMAILHTLSTLGVKRISCTPLNIGDIDTESLDMALIDELLVGMAVDRDTINNGSSSPLGVALLRVLTSAHKSKQTKKRSMISVKTGRGSSDANPFGLTCMIGEQNTKGKKKAPRKKGARPSRAKTTATKPKAATKKTDSTKKQEKTEKSVIIEEGASAEVIESDLWKTDYVAHLETNIDDMTSEHLAYVIELLMKQGAMDAWLVPIIMKKGRAAHTLHCLCDSDEEMTQPLLETIFRHTTTLGVRCYVDVPRAKLYRNTVSVQTSYSDTSRDGIVDVKVATFQDGEIMSMKAEYDHCKVIASETGTPLTFVSDAAVAAARAHVYAESRKNEDFEEYDD